MPSIPANRSKYFVWGDPDLTIASSIFDVTGTVIYSYASDGSIRSFRNGRNPAFNSLPGLVSWEGYLISTGSSSIIVPDSTQGFGIAPVSNVPVPTPSPGSIFSDSFSSTTLNPKWRWRNQPSDFSLTTDPGRLKLRRFEGHGFYQTPGTEQHQSPVPVLYYEDPLVLKNGFQVQFKTGYYANQNYQFGQTGLVVFTGDPLGSQFDNYFKFVYEFDIVQTLHIVYLEEVSGVAQRDPADLQSVPWGGGKIDVELRLTYNNGVITTEYRAIGSNTWIQHFVTNCDIPANTPVRVGFYSESDQYDSNRSNPQDGSQFHAWLDDIEFTIA
jgi:regulation of enolase protein 1 (concanavalin A-like superfamily)